MVWFGDLEFRRVDSIDLDKGKAYVTMFPHGTQSTYDLGISDRATIQKYEHSALPMRFKYTKARNGHLVLSPDFVAYEKVVEAATLQIKELKCL